jgi:hypothetical protein
MRWAGHIERLKEMKHAYKLYSGNLKEVIKYSGDRDMDERIILKWILEKQGGSGWSGFS